MKRRTRNIYTDAQKAEMWNRWQRGDSMHDIARSFDRYHSSIQRILTDNGGIRPKPRKRSTCALTLAEREAISRGLACQQSIRAIAGQLGRSPSTISREIRRNGGYAAYRANKADAAAWQRALRPRFIGYDVLVLDTCDDPDRSALKTADLDRAAFGSKLNTRFSGASHDAEPRSYPIRRGRLWRHGARRVCGLLRRR